MPQDTGTVSLNSQNCDKDEDLSSHTVHKKKANVYDAVAGNVTQAGLFGHIGDSKGSSQPLRVDEVLFKRANAPVRYEETDFYHADTDATANEGLPNGHLLVVLQEYVSSLYMRTAVPGETPSVWRCMDETALLALGILLEETAEQLLGKSGDLALTEGSVHHEFTETEGFSNSTRQAVDSESESLLGTDMSDATSAFL